ncbi:MAG: hypothetical protein WAK67_01120 [Xanthobacteraceae bacterium]
MMATQTFCSAGVLALATIMGPVAPGYAGEPCCAWVYGKYINSKTGKEVRPPKVPLRQGQSRTLQVLLTGTVRSLQKQLHHPSAYIRA